MSDFAPSIEAAQKALGSAIPIVTKHHPAGVKGVALSLDEVAARVRKGRNDPRVRAWAIRSIHAAGGPQDVRGQAQAILTAFKKACVYVQDPLNTEFIQAAHETLCLDDKGLCFRGGDCDDGCVAYGAACLSVGIPVQVIGQSFEPNSPPTHVMCAIQEKNGNWLKVDPSTDKPVGEYVFAEKEWIIDPMDENDKTTATLSGGGDFVGVGGFLSAPPTTGDVIIQQVQSGVYDMQSSGNALAAALDMIAQIVKITGFDPEPTTPVTDIATFPLTGTWSPNMDKIARDFLSQVTFMIQAGQDALDGTRTIYVDASNSVSIGKLPSDSFSWSAVAQTGADLIIAAYDSAGTLVSGVTAQLGEFLKPAQVQAKIPPAGTTQGLGNPVLIGVVAVGVSLACIVEALVVYSVMSKLCDTITTIAREKSYQATAELVAKGLAPASMLNDQRQLMNEAAKLDANNNPFTSGLDSVVSVLKWAAIGGLGIVAVSVAYPVLAELGHSAAATVRAKREAKA